MSKRDSAIYSFSCRGVYLTASAHSVYRELRSGELRVPSAIACAEQFSARRLDRIYAVNQVKVKHGVILSQDIRKFLLVGAFKQP